MEKVLAHNIKEPHREEELESARSNVKYVFSRMI